MRNSSLLLTLFLSIILVAVVSALSSPDLSLCSNTSEDISTSCLINSPNLSISSQSSMVCILSNSTSDNYTLSYQGSSNYNGLASCLISTTDGNESNSSTLIITIFSVNDVPVINSFSPLSASLSIAPGISQIFTVNATDIDSTVAINWYVNNVLVQTGDTFNFSRLTGSYTLLTNATDGSLSATKSWSITIGPTSQYTCTEMNGFYPSGDKLCPGDIINSKDTAKCCSVPYIPAFVDASGCSIANKSIQIGFNKPLSSDLFELGDQIEGEYKITNSYTQDQNFDVGAYLYDLTSDTYEVYRSDDMSLKTGQTSTITLNLKIPEDLDLTDDYVLMVKAEDEICNMNYIPLSIRRPRHIVQIKSFTLPDEAYCGETINSEIKIENSGSNDENVHINLKNLDLSLDQSTDKFSLDKYSGNNKALRTIQFKVPDNAKNGNYSIKLNVYYSDENRMELMSKNIKVSGCKELITLSTTNTNNTAQNQSDSSVFIVSDWNKILISAGISGVLIIAILGVLYKINRIKVKETEDLFDKPVKKTRIKLEK